jgi:hypothetical protein
MKTIRPFRRIGSAFQIALLCFILLAGLLPSSLKAANDSIPHDTSKKSLRVPLVAGGAAVLYGSSMVVLSKIWYSGHPQDSFHFFNDDNEWLQMDKCGHTFTSYYEGVYGFKMLSWAGLSHKQATWYGGAFGLLMQTPIEILDGFSSEWGFSWGDQIANTTGSALFISQELAWQEQKVQLKFSYFPSVLAKRSPSLLGSTVAENLIKDYNAQTYWLSGELSPIFPKAHIPSWLNIAAGYGATGMLRGTYFDQTHDLVHPEFASVERQRQFFLSLDVNWLKIKTQNKVLKQVFTLLAFIKVPAPAIEYREHAGVHLHILYF